MTALVIAAFIWPDRAIKTLPVIQIAGGVFGGSLLAYAGRTAISFHNDNFTLQQ